MARVLIPILILILILILVLVLVLALALALLLLFLGDRDPPSLPTKMAGARDRLNIHHCLLRRRRLHERRGGDHGGDRELRRGDGADGAGDHRGRGDRRDGRRRARDGTRTRQKVSHRTRKGGNQEPQKQGKRNKLTHDGAVAGLGLTTGFLRPWGASRFTIALFDKKALLRAGHCDGWGGCDSDVGKFEEKEGDPEGGLALKPTYSFVEEGSPARGNWRRNTYAPTKTKGRRDRLNKEP